MNPKTIEKWKNLASETNSNIEFKLFKIDFKTALERDGNRSRSVGKKVLERFFFNYFPEELKEYYTDKRKFIEYDEKKKDCIIVDLDGTLCVHDSRSPYDWSKVGTGKPNIPLIKILKVLNKQYEILFVSGREGTLECSRNTLKWLINNFYSPYSETELKGWDLIMRNVEDYRPDNIVKEELFHNYIEPRCNVIAVFDDRDCVVKMWRSLGILCNQVYYGDF